MKHQKEPTVLTVNNERISEQLIADEIEHLRPRHHDVFHDLPEPERERQLCEWATENVIDAVLLCQAAALHVPPLSEEQLQKLYEATVHSNGGDQRFLDRVNALGLTKEHVLRDLDLRQRKEQYLRSIHEHVAEPHADEVHSYYAAHVEDFTLPEMVRAGHVVAYVNDRRPLPEAEEIMKEVLRGIEQGTSLEELANTYSDCADNDGDLGWFPKGEMVEEFENAVFALSPGNTSGIIRTPFGLHIAKVYDTRPAHIQPLEDVRHVIVQRLMDKKRQDALEATLDALRSTAIILRVQN